MNASNVTFAVRPTPELKLSPRLGKGAYGIVWMAKEKRSGRVVALKKCFDAFRNGTDAQVPMRDPARYVPIF